MTFVIIIANHVKNTNEDWPSPIRIIYVKAQIEVFDVKKTPKLIITLKLKLIFANGQIKLR